MDETREQKSQTVGGHALVGFARMNLSQLGRRMRYVRRLKGLSQKQLAAMLRCHDRSVANWECGKRVPTLNHLAHIADICDTTIPYLLGYEGYDEPLRIFTGELPVRTTSPTDKLHAAKERPPRNPQKRALWGQ